MKAVKETIREVADNLGEYIKNKIERSLSPINVLTYMVEKHGEPVLCFDNVFDPKGKDVKDIAYGVYVSHVNEHLGYSAPAGTGELMILGKGGDGELFNSDAETFIDFFSFDINEYEQKKLEFANHFLNAMEKGLTYEKVKGELMGEVMRSVAKTIPYADIISSYPMEEVGEYHNGYEGQCYVEDCREADNRRCMTEEELEIEKECRKQREEHERGEREL